MGFSAVAAFACLLLPGIAQDPAPSAPNVRPSPQAAPTAAAQREAMKKIAFLVGEWEGEGWTEFVPGQRRTSPIREVVQSKMDGMILLVEGIGKMKSPSGAEVVTHHAVGILDYDPGAKRYRMRSYLMDGRSVEAEAEMLPDGAFQWRFSAPGNTKVRYTVRLTARGEWFEQGEMSVNGTTWRQFHEMTLRRISPAGSPAK
jgi:hypothetical protein